MEDNYQSFFSESAELLKDYAEARIGLVKLQLAARLAYALGVFFTLFVASLFFFFIVVFLGMVVGFWIGGLTGSNAIGFLISTLIFAILLAIVVIFRKKLIQKPIVDIILSGLLEETPENEEDSPQNDLK